MVSSSAQTKCIFFDQACSNEKFLLSVEEASPSNFHDWKATIVFYCALHYLKSFAKTKGIKLIQHKDTFNKLYSQGDGKPPELVVDVEIRRYYKILFEFAHTTRYDGFLEVSVSGKVGKLRVKDAKQYLELIKDWIVPRLGKAGVDIAT